MESTEQFAQRCLDSRGYVVIGCNYPLQRGEFTQIDDQPITYSEIRGVVVSQTDKADMVEQLVAMGVPEEVPLNQLQSVLSCYRRIEKENHNEKVPDSRGARICIRGARRHSASDRLLAGSSAVRRNLLG